MTPHYMYFQSFWPKSFWEDFFKDIAPFIPIKNLTHCGSTLPKEIMNVYHKLESTLPDDIFTQVTALFAEWFSQNKIFKDVSF